MKEEYNIAPEEIASDLLDSVTERAGSEYIDEFITTKTIEIENHIRTQMTRKERKGNIVFRGKSLFSGEYVCGDLSYFYRGPAVNDELINPITLAVSLPDMVDAEHNKLYASLNDKGTGGSIVRINYSEKTKEITKKSYWDPVVVLIMKGYEVSYLKHSDTDFSDNVIFNLTYNKESAEEMGIF